MCDDVEKTVVELRAKGVEVLRPVADVGWVSSWRSKCLVPARGLYQPKPPGSVQADALTTRTTGARHTPRCGARPASAHREFVESRHRR